MIVYFFLWALLNLVVSFAIQPNVATQGAFIKRHLEPLGNSCTDVTFLFLVHTTPARHWRRQMIRQTWGSSAKDHVVFIMGREKDRINKKKSLRSPKMDNVWTSSSVQKEAAVYRDILQGDFTEHELNQTLKHLMGLEWTRNNCMTKPPVLIVKMDDDVFVEIFHLHQFVKAVYAKAGTTPPSKSLICDVIQSPSPQSSVAGSNNASSVIIKGQPDHCNGAAFMMTPDLIDPLLEAAHKQLGQDRVLNEDDDVFITGVLRESLGLGSPRFLNPRYTFDITSVEKWLRGSSGLPLPWIFAGGITDVQLMSQLWTKTLQIHDETKF